MQWQFKAAWRLVLYIQDKPSNENIYVFIEGQSASEKFHLVLLDKSRGGPQRCSWGWSTSSVRTRQFELFSLEKRRLWGEFIAPSSTEGAPQESSRRTFYESLWVYWWMNGMALSWKRGYGLAIRKKSFTVKVVKLWQRELVNAPSLTVSKSRLDGSQGSLV